MVSMTGLQLTDSMRLGLDLNMRLTCQQHEAGMGL